MERRFTFDRIAELYDRSRPGYPASIFGEIADLAGLAPGARVLEVGCGTGQATRELVRCGWRVVAIEPGEALAQRARQNLADADVEVRCQTFEEASLESGGFDLVLAAQSWHWIPPAVSYPKAAAALREDGALAILGNAERPVMSALRSKLDDAYRMHAPSIAGPPVTGWYGPEGPVEGLIAEAEAFSAPTVRRVPWSRAMSTAEYLDLLRTHSDHQLLEATQLDALLGAIETEIDAQGGRISVDYEANLYLAMRAGPAPAPA